MLMLTKTEKEIGFNRRTKQMCKIVFSWPNVAQVSAVKVVAISVFKILGLKKNHRPK